MNLYKMFYRIVLTFFALVPFRALKRNLRTPDKRLERMRFCRKVGCITSFSAEALKWLSSYESKVTLVSATFDWSSGRISCWGRLVRSSVQGQV